MKRLEDKVVLITGGALGIGEAACRQCAEEGAIVAITDILDEEGHLLKENIKSVFNEVEENYGKIDVLVNNAGISGVNKPTDQIQLEEWQKVININVNGVFLCTRQAIPSMRQKGGGSIINLSSIYGIISAPDIPAYHASKGAVRSMTKTDALLYAKDKIRVNSVHPGFIWTPLVETMGKESKDGVEQFKKNLDGLHPLGHVGEPSDIAHGIVYLASDESKFITGSELVIDGGYISQ